MDAYQHHKMDRMIAKFWCRSCDRSTRLLPDGRRCIECHPLAGTDEWRPPPWCGECDQRTRLAETVRGVARCLRCHPMARPPMRWPVALIPETWADQLAACEWLCYVSPTLRRLGVDGLRKALRKYFEHRWTPNDVLYALDHTAVGETQIGSAPTGQETAAQVSRWLDQRLRRWEDSDGIPITPIGDHIAVNREQKVAAQAIARIDWEQRASKAADPVTNPHVADARKAARAAAARSRLRRSAADARELSARQAQLHAEDHRRHTLEVLEKYIRAA